MTSNAFLAPADAAAAVNGQSGEEEDADKGDAMKIKYPLVKMQFVTPALRTEF